MQQLDEFGLYASPGYRRPLSSSQHGCLWLDAFIVGGVAWIFMDDNPCGTGAAFMGMGVVVLFVIATVLAFRAASSGGPTWLSRALITVHLLPWLAFLIRLIAG